MRTEESLEPLSIETDTTLNDMVSVLEDTIAQCEINVFQCSESTGEGAITSIWEQVEDIERMIKELARSEQDYINLPAYQQHCQAVEKFKMFLSALPEPGESKELGDAGPLDKIKKLLHTQLLAAGFFPRRSSDLFAFIVRVNPPTEISDFLEKFYSKLLSEEKQLFVERLVPYCITKRSVTIENLVFLYPLIKVDMEKADNWTLVYLAKGLGEDPKNLTEKYWAIFEEKSSYKKNLLMEFIGYGTMTKSGGLLTCAQLASRKSYSINATVLDTYEIENYFKAIQQCSTKNMIEHFVMVGDHWLSGVIEKQPNGYTRVLVIDDLGKMNNDSKPLVDAFFTVFPEGVFFRNHEKLQRSSQLACAVFALEHLRHFPKIGLYLGGIPLMEYFSQQETKKSQELGDTDSRIKFCHLPLPLLRVMEDNALHKQIIQGREPKERECPINSDGKNAAQCVQQDFKYVEELSSLRNQRIRLVRDKFFFHNQRFLNQRSKDQIEKLMKDFTLAGFRRRIASSSAVSKAEEMSHSTGYNFYRLMSGPAPQSMSDDSIRGTELDTGWGRRESIASKTLCEQIKSGCDC